MEKKVDKTKEKIGVSKLHEDDRKKLYNKFVDAGGKVVDEKEIKKNLIIDREKQKTLKKKIEQQRDKDKKSIPRKTAPQKIYRPGKRLNQSDNPFLVFFQRLKIKFKLKFMGVTGFNGLFFDLKFLQRFNNIYKTSLMEMQMIYFDIFKSDPPTGRKVIEELDKQRPLYFEVIELMGKIYNDNTIRQIVEHYKTFPDVPKNTSELKEPLMEIFKKLFVLKLYENTILNSYEKALAIRLKIDKDKTSSYSQQRRKLKNNLYDIFHKLFPRLYWLFCFYEGVLYDMSDPEIDNVLAISIEDKPGTRLLMKKKDGSPGSEDEGDQSEIDESEDKKESFEGLDEPVKKGLSIIYSLDYKKMRGEYDKSDLFKIVSLKDKILVTYLLFSEFDKEYSCILTTNKIKYKKDMDVKGLKDYKAVMQNFYDQMRKCFDSFKDYSEITSNFIKTSEDKPVSNAQYLQYTKRLNEIQKKRNQVAQNTRDMIRGYMDKLSDELKFLIDDMKNVRKFVDNPDDVLEFIPQIEGEKKINGKKIIDAIGTVYYFTSAFAYRLGFDGDLSGDPEFKSEDMLNRQMKPDTEDLNEKKDSAKKTMESEEKSILDELDDAL